MNLRKDHYHTFFFVLRPARLESKKKPTTDSWPCGRRGDICLRWFIPPGWVCASPAGARPTCEPVRTASGARFGVRRLASEPPFRWRRLATPFFLPYRSSEKEKEASSPFSPSLSCTGLNSAYRRGRQARPGTHTYQNIQHFQQRMSWLPQR